MTPATLPPALLEEREQVDRALGAYLDEALARVGELHPELDAAADELRAFVLGGGKRLRPLFLVTGFEAAGGTPRTAVRGAALALELLHTCALLHDDVIDDAPTRRGRPTTNRRFATRHRELGLRGDPERFGEAVAILLGDLAFVHADEAFLGCDLPADQLLAGLRTFTTLREEVTAGQYLDVVAAHRQDGSGELALEVASLKSGRYSVARPLELGAVLAGEPRTGRALYQLGLPLGIAFQLRDDLLGVFGTEATTGKSAASDLVEGKRTLLVAETLRRLDGAERDRFLGAFGNPDLDAADVDRLREQMERSGGRAAVEQRIDDLTAEALSQLDQLDLPEPAGTWLRSLTEHVTRRTR